MRPKARCSWSIRLHRRTVRGNTLTRRMQQQIIAKKIAFYVIDAYAIAKQTGMGNRINTIMQTCFFAISGVLPRDVAIEKIKLAAKKSYGKKGQRGGRGQLEGDR